MIPTLDSFIESLETLSNARGMDTLNPIGVNIKHPTVDLNFLIVVAYSEPQLPIIPVKGMWLVENPASPFFRKIRKLSSVSSQNVYTWVTVTQYEEIFADPQVYVSGSEWDSSSLQGIYSSLNQLRSQLEALESLEISAQQLSVLQANISSLSVANTATSNRLSLWEQDVATTLQNYTTLSNNLYLQGQSIIQIQAELDSRSGSVLLDSITEDPGSHTKYPSVYAVVQYVASAITSALQPSSLIPIITSVVKSLSAHSLSCNLLVEGDVPLFVGSVKLAANSYTPIAKLGCTNAEYKASVLINVGPDTISSIGNVAGAVQWRTGETFILSNETDIDIYLVANSVSATAELRGLKL